MWRYPDGTIKLRAPARVEYAGYIRNFADLTPEQRDNIGYNEAVPLKRDAFTTYTTEWAKGEDLVYREVATSAVVDEVARDSAQAEILRLQRNSLLAESDWTQLPDAPLTDDQKKIWSDYRQELRDAPTAAGWPVEYKFPEPPAEG